MINTIDGDYLITLFVDGKENIDLKKFLESADRITIE
jgi:hypothetical protein